MDHSALRAFPNSQGAEPPCRLIYTSYHPGKDGTAIPQVPEGTNFYAISAVGHVYCFHSLEQIPSVPFAIGPVPISPIDTSRVICLGGADSTYRVVAFGEKKFFTKPGPHTLLLRGGKLICKDISFKPNRVQEKEFEIYRVSS